MKVFEILIDVFKMLLLIITIFLMAYWYLYKEDQNNLINKFDEEYKISK